MIGIASKKDENDEEYVKSEQDYKFETLSADYDKKKRNYCRKTQQNNINPDYQNQMFTNRTILLNPGINYKIREDDICFYISLVKEENYEAQRNKSKLCKWNLLFLILFIV